jgi:hypothetical protein
MTQESLHVRITTNEDIAHHFLHYQGVKFIPQGQTVNQAHYVEILKWLHEAVHRERPGIWSTDWILHHDNVPADKVLSGSFWPKNQSLKWNTHPIPLIWL